MTTNPLKNFGETLLTVIISLSLPMFIMVASAM